MITTNERIRRMTFDSGRVVIQFPEYITLTDYDDVLSMLDLARKQVERLRADLLPAPPEEPADA